MGADPVEMFAARARAFCAFVERAPSLSVELRLVEARLQLTDLYAAALRLPPPPRPDRVEPGVNPSPPASWLGFGDREVYWEVFDPYEEDKPCCGSLSDDVLDIFGDVACGLAFWEGGHTADAHWEWRFGFDAHWGDHAVDALRALHRACTYA